MHRVMTRLNAEAKVPNDGGIQGGGRILAGERGQHVARRSLADLSDSGFILRMAQQNLEWGRR